MNAGKVYREYPCDLGKCQILGLDGLTLQIPGEVDLEHAVHAEVAIELANEHMGFEDIAVSLNGGQEHRIPFPDTSPRDPPPSLWYHHWYPIIGIALSDVKTGTGNTIRLRAGEKCFDGVIHPNGTKPLDPWMPTYGVTLRVLYDPTRKPHPTGRITSPAPNSTVGLCVDLTASAQSPNGPIRQIDFVGRYEDINYEGDGIYDFLVQPRSAKTFVDRICLYGYRRGFVYLDCLDVNRLSRVHLVPNVGPACPGRIGPGRTYSWIYGIVVSSPDNVGVQVGRSDGYVFTDLMFFGVHTALRLGASREYPIHDPVAGVDAYDDPVTKERKGFATPYAAQGPWGVVNGFMADQCTIGIHLVWPTPLTNRMTNVAVHTAFSDGMTLPWPGVEPKPISKQGAVVVEPTHVLANGIGIAPVLMLTNLSVGSFSDPERFAGAASGAGQCNGRVFLVGGDVTIEATNVQINSPYDEAITCAFGPAAKQASVRLRGLVRTGRAVGDVEIRSPGVTPTR